MDSKPHLSISQLNMLSFCGEQYRRRYIMREKIPPGISLLVGKSVDNSVNSNMTNKVENDELLPLEQVKDIARDSLNNEWDSQEVFLSDEEKEEGVKQVKGKAVDKSVRLSALHATDIAGILKPTHVQRKWEIELQGYPYDLIGYIDLQEGSYAIRDTKTASKTPPLSAADMSDQLTIYAMASMAIDGIIPETLCLDYLVDNKKPKVEILTTYRCVEDFEPMLRRIENAIEVIEKGVFVPARQDNFLCSPRFCGFYSNCPYVRKKIYFNGGITNA